MRNAIKLNIVRDGGMAAAAGLAAGDVLLSFDGVALLANEDLTSALRVASAPARVDFVRSGCLLWTTVSPGRLDVVFAVVEIDDSKFSENEPEQLGAKPLNVLDRIVVTTAPSIDGYVAVKQLGVVTSECVFGLNFFKDFFAAVSDIFGGRSKTTQQALREAREKCIEELKAEAHERGANAVIAVSLDYSEFSGQGKSMLFLVASGTAVVVEPVVNPLAD